MTQADEQATQAEQRTQETRSFVRQVRAATRRKYTPEEKIRLEGFFSLTIRTIYLTFAARPAQAKVFQP